MCRLHVPHAVTTFSQLVRPPHERGMTMVECELMRRTWLATILTSESIAQEYVEARKCRARCERHIFYQRNNAR